ncbi:hypothetical protein [Nocardia vaccinii]|uniref:hypothetical protein n=1 Tax=Nocardia vaccinii TaxID=1822 RepID=UPI0008379E24|nr:hypothetical protein [Nocardia vaccinii]
MAAANPVRGLDEPEKHDYPAAAGSLELLADPRPTLLPPDDPHARADPGKISAGNALSPIPLVQGDPTAGTRARIGNGYDRTCSHADENIPIRTGLTALRGDDGRGARDSGKQRKRKK